MIFIRNTDAHSSPIHTPFSHIILYFFFCLPPSPQKTTAVKFRPYNCLLFYHDVRTVAAYCWYRYMVVITQQTYAYTSHCSIPITFSNHENKITVFPKLNCGSLNVLKINRNLNTRVKTNVWTTCRVSSKL